MEANLGSSAVVFCTLQNYTLSKTKSKKMCYIFIKNATH